MKSIEIKDDRFEKKNVHQIDGGLPKLCWGCWIKHEKGLAVWDASKLRRIFFCQECFDKLS